MTIEDRDEEKHRQWLIKNIQSECIILLDGSIDNNKLNLIKEWCLGHIGEDRGWHPIYEAQSGWMDYFDGEWAITTQGNDINVWIYGESNRALFKLTWLPK